VAPGSRKFRLFRQNPSPPYAAVEGLLTIIGLGLCEFSGGRREPVRSFWSERVRPFLSLVGAVKGLTLDREKSLPPKADRLLCFVSRGKRD